MTDNPDQLTAASPRTRRFPPVLPTEYAEPVRIDDRTTVIPVSRRTILGNTVPVGLFTVFEGNTTWTPAIDAGRIALIGVLTGLIAATLNSAAVLRQPPWPRITLHRK